MGSQHYSDSDEFRTIIANALDGFTLVNSSGYIIDVNDSYCKLVGYTRNELLRMHMSDIDAADSTEDVAERSREIILKGSLRFETKQRHKNGTIIDVEVSANYSTIRGGSFFSFVRDISQNKLLEQALCKSEERYRTIFEQSLDAIFYTNPNGIIYNANPSACKMFGMTEQELCAAGRDGIINKHDPRLERAVEERKLSHQINTELTAIRKNGEIFPIEISSVITSEVPRLSFVIIRDISERKRAEELLIKSDAKFSLAFKLSPEAIVIVSLETGKYIDVNDNFLQISGFERAEILGKTPLELNFWVDPPERQMYLDELSKAGSYKRRGIKFRLKNDEVRIFQISSAIIEIEGERCSLNFISDITEQIQAENRLRLSEEKFSTAFRVSPDAINLTRLSDGKYIEINKGFTELTGFTSEDVVGKTSIELNIWVDPEDRIRLTTGLKERGVVNNLEAQFRRKDGSILTGFMSARTIVIENEPCLLSITRDYSERKRIEETLKQSEYFFRESQRAARIGSYSADFKNDHWTSSEVLDTIFGIDQSYNRSIQGWIDLVHPDDRDMMSHYLREEIINGRKPFSKEYRIKRKNVGETRWVRGLGEATFDDNGNIQLLTGTIQDITEFKELEKEHVKLEKLESLGVLAGGIAHDFNNILTAIMGNVSFAQMFLDEAHKSYKPLVEAEKASKRASELAQQLLIFSRGGEPIKKVFSLQHLVRETVSLVLRGSNVKGDVNIPDTIHAVEADEGQIGQVFHNIIINATQAMPGGGMLAVTAQNKTIDKYNSLPLQSGNYVCITFTDQGCGISEEDQKKIFDPYFTTKLTGNGLGLASAHSIVIKHGGHISVSSIVGEGTTFTIFLPAISEIFSEYRTDSVTLPDSSHRGKSILIMEDEEIIRDMMTEMLKYIGYQVTTAENGETAIAHYKVSAKAGSPYSAVIMDLTIPGGMGGMEAAKHILAIDPDARLIVSSGYSNDPIMSECERYGFKTAVAKPYNIAKLEQALNFVLKK